MKILVCGGRDYDDVEHFNSRLRQIINVLLMRMSDLELEDYTGGLKKITIISGGARGADTLAERFAEQYGFELKVVPAEWDTYGKAAGKMRNQKMLTEENPDYVVAFPGGTGTAHMARISEMAGVPVIRVERRKIL